MNEIEEKLSLDEVHIDELLAHVVQAKCSELHLEVGKSPLMRQRGSDALIELVSYVPVRPQKGRLSCIPFNVV